MDTSIEQKYIFPEKVSPILLEWLRYCCVPDPKFSAGSISSIYYDTPTYALYDEKRNSDYLKFKVRLRWYSDLARTAVDGDVKCYLEVKHKCGVLREKRRIELMLPGTMLEGDPFSQEEILQMPQRLHELSYQPPGVLVPIALIQYKRYRFVDPESGSRIALDAGICCPRVNTNFIIGSSSTQLSAGVLEVKGPSRKFPSFLMGIRSYVTREAFSKYARCCESFPQPLGRRI